MTPSIDALQWLRPHWLWALLLVPAGLAIWWRRRRASNAWTRHVDAHLLVHLLERNAPAGRRWGVAMMALAAVLAITALAGPSFGMKAQPLWQTRTPLLVVLDLSSAALAADVPPNRLAVARAKIGQVLSAQAGAQVGLVAFAGEPFTIAPLTDDAANVALFLDALHPDVMPVDGRDTAAALDHAASMLERGGFRRGRVLLLTDSADAAALAAAVRLRGRGYTLDVLGLGSPRGAPYRGPRGIQTARLDTGAVQALATAGGGRHAAATLDIADLRSLGAFDASRMDGAVTQAQGTQRRDDGFWLLPAVLLLSIAAFRRGGVVAMLAVCVMVPMPDARADPWRREDQRAHARMVDGHQAYRRGQFDAAAREYAAANGPVAHYNRGNALAKAGQYPAAVAAYDQALRLRPGMPDAMANRAAVLAAMKRPTPPGGKRPKPGSAKGGQGSSGTGASKSPPSQSGSDRARPPPSAASAPAGSTSTPAPPARVPPPRADAAARAAQRAADAAQRARMNAAQGRTAQRPPPVGATRARAPESPAQRERRIANEALLRRIPDDPGALLRARLRLEHERRQLEGRRQ